MTTRAETLAAVRAAGRRITPQRQVVLDVIETSSQHLDAEAIFQKAREKDPAISLATVYRTLAVFKDIGLVDQSYTARTHTREHYEPVGAPRHYHFTCLDCHQVIEFQTPGLTQLISQIQGELGAEISHVCMCVEGYCRDCAPKHKAR
jgi:Fe2+ or Zn2+ uptake regulation protein